ncbi:hypothetical protein POM88_010402 [Heracleum sosnowskyi]|uniref:Replication protein A subunit n=1 Tax=Heracleum sosnowskyi TaxID=360622 RepID=A0AAD8IV15_9APIA|nr:hypothetical protein POM88_010402 [Heracleum sosnowskyi]
MKSEEKEEVRKEVVGRSERAISKKTELLGVEPLDTDKLADGPTYEHRPNVAIDIHAISLFLFFCTPSTMTMPGQVGGTSSSTSRANSFPGTASTMTIPGQVGGASSSASRPSPLSGPETPRKRNNIDKRKQAFAANNVVLNLGSPDQECGFCQALVWSAEFTGRHVGGGPKGYSICCGKGKVQLPLLRETPPELLRLLTGGGREGQLFRREIRTYNNIFAFVSFGGDVDNSVNSGRGPFVFRIRGHTYHSIGSLSPPPGCTPKFAQIYMYDAQEALQYRLQFPGRENALAAPTISSLSQMLERENTLVAIFKQIRERFRDVEQVPMRLTLLERRSNDGRYDSLAVCREYGHPDLFITFTCNPKWEEIKYAVELCGSSDASVRPDIIARVFKLKLDAMMSDLTKHDVLGRVVADKDVPPVTIDGRKISFSTWVLSLGNGSERTTPLDNENDPSWVRIPDEVHVKYTGDPVDVIVDEIYAELHLKYKDVEYLRDRAILTPLNENVGIINKKVLDRLPGESKIYKSCDTICKGSSTSDSAEWLSNATTSCKLVSALSFGLQEETIKVRVIRLWNGISYRASDEAATYFVLLDEEDNQTLALSQLTGRARFLAELHEGLVYYITNFKIVAGPPKWNPVIAGKVILLHTQTKAWPCYDSCSIARMKFVLSPFPTIATRLEDMTALFADLSLDVSGVIYTVGNIKHNNHGVQKLGIKLIDERGAVMTISLWGFKATQFDMKFSIYRQKNVVLVVTGLLPKCNTDKGTLLVCILLPVELGEENQIIATVRNSQRANVFPLISEGKVYRISDVRIASAPKKYRAVDRDIAITYYHGTQIEPTRDTAIIPQHKFELTALENIANFVNVVYALIDVTGMVTDYGNPERASNGALKKDIVLANERGKKMTVTLWEEKAEQFQTALNETRGVPVFVVISGLLAKNFADNVTLSSTDATKSYLNIDYKPVIELRAAVVAASGKPIAQLLPPVNRPFVTASSNTLQRLTIQEILAYQLPCGEKLARCLCHAEITAILDGEGWYYTCCPKCARKVRLLGQGYYCGSCAENVSDPKQRYKLIVRVVDISGTTTFTLFNKEVERLVVVPVENILAELTQDNPATEIPAVLNNVIGKTCGFDVKISSYNTNLGYEEYTVVKLSEYDPAEVQAVAETSGAGAEAQNAT